MKWKNNGNDLVCVSAVRTPFGRFGGSLKDIDIYDLSAIIMKEAIERIGLDPSFIGEVWWGTGDTTNTKDPYTPVVARQSLLKAGISPETPSVSFDQACISAMTAAMFGTRSIRLNNADVVLTGGATSFSTVPFLLRGIRWEGKRHSSFLVEDPIVPLGYKDYAPVAVDSGNVALDYHVAREEQDDLAYDSHIKYGKSLKRGFFQHELMHFEIEKKDRKGQPLSKVVLEKDEQYRFDIKREDLSKLKTVFGSPTCTAGNAPGMNDGAAAQIFMKRCMAERLNLPPLYTIVSMSSIALKPRIMPVSPAFAIKKCLDESGLKIENMTAIEINEAFACVPLVSAKLLSNERFMNANYKDMAKEVSESPILDYNPEQYSRLKDKLNENGGAIAIGHPNTASGARLMMTAAYNLREKGGGYAACAICGGLTQGAACVIRVG
jgi:acetyl-CoA C-acetyltransferase